MRTLHSLFLIIACSLLVACDTATRMTVISGPTMGTTYSVKIAEPLDAPREQQLRGVIETTLERVLALMSTYRENSELSRFNRARPGDWFEISGETGEVLATAQQVSELTGGAFDVTVGPLVNLWGFGPDGRPERVPVDSELDAAFARTGYRHLELEAGRARRQRDLYVDLSAIAKGYAVDLVARKLREAGVNNFLVEIGGELKGVGRKPDGSPWRIAIESAHEGSRRVQRVVRVEGTGIATSGDYRNYFEHDGVRYSHTIDPATGRPVAHGLASVTVIEPSAARADAMATALMVLGPERGYRLAEEQQLAVFFIIRQDGTFIERHTPDFSLYLEPES